LFWIKAMKSETVFVSRIGVAVSLLMTLLFVQATAQFAQLGSKLVGTGAVGPFVYQGMSVSISADGNTALVGATRDNNDVGAVWVFTRSNNVWTQQGTKLVGSGASGATVYQGTAVALSGDGNTAVAGAYGDNSEQGATWVFTRTGSTWAQQGSKLVGNGGVSFMRQGSTVALSADGNTAIIGGPYDNAYKGAAWVFSRSGTVWTQQGAKLVGSAATSTSYQGASVSISADGNTAIVGGSSDAGATGATWVFTRSGGVWTQQGPKLVGTGYVGASNQGGAVSLSSDGNTAVVGGFGDNGYAGAVWVFTRNAGVWSQQGGKLVGSGAIGIAEQGSSVSISADGNTIVVGGYRDNNYVGALWVFTRAGGVWTQQGSKLVGAGPVGGAEQAKSVSVSGDGKTIISGGPIDNSNTGAAWLFYNPATEVSEVNSIPNQFTLRQNYPNPFNPTTVVGFQLPAASDVRLAVYDLLGREVAVPVNERKAPGTYEVKFDGSGLASGVYLYRLSAGSFVQSRKFVLLK
jgi:hypothetical protein